MRSEEHQAPGDQERKLDSLDNLEMSNFEEWDVIQQHISGHLTIMSICCIENS